MRKLFPLGAAGLAILALPVPVMGQSLIVPDETLGAERSQVNTVGNVERITGGARRSQNLFHSFEEFNVSEGRGAFFESPAGLENIFSRVTGDNPSNILGALGTIGDSSPDLYLMNPNGILFGPNSSLDVQGSFVATTAHAIQFGEQGSFGATSPEAPSELLTVNPSAFFFNGLIDGVISNSSRTRTELDPSGSFNPFGLRVPDGNSLLLVGGDIDISGGGLVAFGGRIELAAVDGSGEIFLNTSSNNLDINLPTPLERADISLSSDAGLVVSGNASGSINIYSKNLSIADGSSIQTGILSGLGSNTILSGNILINSTGIVEISGTGSEVIGFVDPNTLGNAGDITLRANRLVIRDGALVAGVTNGAGNVGDLRIQVNGQLDISNGGFLTNQVNQGSGSSGDLIIEADQVNVTDDSLILADTFGQGNSGRLLMELGSLSIQDSSRVSSSTYDQGNSGGISISASGNIELNDSLMISNIGSNARGNSGGVVVNTGSLLLENGGQILSDVFGEGSAGSVTIIATDFVALDGRNVDNLPSIVASSINPNASGSAGGINITTPSLEITNRAQISSDTSGIGASEDIVINASDQVRLQNSIIISEVSDRGGVGDGGDVVITTGSLELLEGSAVLADTENIGNAGNIRINARETIILSGEGPSALDIDDIVSSQISTTVEGSATTEANVTVEGGNIDLQTGQLLITDGSFINASTSGQGDAGDIDISTEGLLLLSGQDEDGFPSFISANVEEGAVGDSGEITIVVEELQVVDGAQILSAVAGEGESSGISITASGGITLSNADIITEVTEETGRGRGGNISISANSLELRDGSSLLADTENIGSAGNIRVNIRESMVLAGQGPGPFDPDQMIPSQISTTVERDASGQGGSMAIDARQLTLRDDAFITSETSGDGDAGSINIQVNSLRMFEGTTLSSETNGLGNAGDIVVTGANAILIDGASILAEVSQNASTIDSSTIDINTRLLQLRSGGTISASTTGQGNAGNILVDASDRLIINGALESGPSSGIFTTTDSSATGRGGAIRLSTANLQLSDGGVINARTRNNRPGGNIFVEANEINILRGGQIITTTAASGEAGNIALSAEEIRLFGRDPSFLGRRDRADESSDQFDNVSRGRSGLFASTQDSAEGNGGSITVEGEQLIIRDRGIISAESGGGGTAGNLRINVRDRLELINSDVTTTAPSAFGGDIRINTAANSQNALTRLEGDSDITTNSLGDGGNITIRGAAIIATDDSDIVSSSGEASGGNITLTRLFSDPTPPGSDDDFDGNGQVDLNASGALSSGTITTPDTSFLQNSLADLPEGLINTEGLIANSCIVRNEDGSSFSITGSGGLPEQPGTTVPNYATGDVQPIPTEAAPWQPGDPIVEPQGVYQLPNGELILSHACQ